MTSISGIARRASTTDRNPTSTAQCSAVIIKSSSICNFIAPSFHLLWALLKHLETSVVCVIINASRAQSLPHCLT